MQIQEATMDLTSMAMDQNQSMWKDDDKLRVFFHVEPHFNQDKSNKEGRPIYDDTEYVTIIVPGQQDIVRRKAWAQDRERFSKQYAAFKNKRDQDLESGTPLKLIPWLTASQIKELEFFNIMTVEHLAGAADSIASRFMGFQAMKQRAKDFLTAAKEAAPLTAMRAELDERDQKIAVLERQMKQLIERAEAAEAAAE